MTCHGRLKSTRSSPKLIRSWASPTATSEEVFKNARNSPSSPWCTLGLSIIWGPYLQKDYNSIERVQRKAAKWVTPSQDRRTSVTKLLKNLQWDSLRERRRQQRLLIMYKILNDQVAVPAKSIDLTYSSRPVQGVKNKTKIFKPRTYTTEVQKSFVHI